MIPTRPNGDRPAYPTDRIADEACHANGLTKREAFALAAMQGMLAGDWGTIAGVVCSAYEIADAMLAEGERRAKDGDTARQEGRTG